jgi:regulatory protein
MTASPPDAASLHEAALAYLARYASTERGLRRILERRIDRWARAASSAGGDPEATARQVATARDAVHGVVTRLVAAGAVSDAAFAVGRARSLARAGRSRLAIAAHLAAKGVGNETVRTALGDDSEGELSAALISARRRRIGPFRRCDAPEPTQRQKELAALARLGFTRDVGERALAMDRDDAETLINRARQVKA